jgi:hypothetical protein
MANASNYNIYELPVINMNGGLDIWNEEEDWSVTWHAVQCLGFPVLDGCLFQASVTAGVFYKNKSGIEFQLTVI